ncbi:bifunctional 4-hydroxy-2-oxoglutarate aldolase/2-dehydro-3-deoxy-phosphogluconate aldolase [Carboxydochorda subterranea]|uniref:Bifunctional 4-hydroxy-2-oxoglutarate aldolase/2-dehydro-3-deoxy-phosphogluconate aldolase n=1 Tax=Carboxydichorda subterranea TaxID=3109565 RepID=A0ABZ1BUQ4_9FIRM|nr:bifunctional 4-hydroxy-2-oxoglutarate aldolase/2-dehydro-3-deoxy-phosphogluconate aldolase [Limnochorda sp. L945t]WRP16541.1 bifunctional 4-hydroxy-2-oxoglutarate aldolase/2-dehydro-3-deoxy-phosphogluconate aldolase [Limnochorda sp. L945t]
MTTRGPKQILGAIIDIGMIPIIRVGHPETALRVGQALLEGGLRTLEVTFTVPGADRVIESLRREHPDLLVGAGTVLDEATARAAVAAGAHYLVSAGTFEPVIRTGHRYGLPVFPGVMTPTEAVQALELGADVLKLFPASVLGPEYLKALRAPLPQALWCPTGGVSLDNLQAWFEAGATVVGVGGPLLRDVERSGDYAGLRERARTFVHKIEEIRAAVR